MTQKPTRFFLAILLLLNVTTAQAGTLPTLQSCVSITSDDLFYVRDYGATTPTSDCKATPAQITDYLEDQFALLFLPLLGGTMAGTISMDGNPINMGGGEIQSAGTINGDYLNISGGGYIHTNGADIDLGGGNITTLADDPYDATGWNGSFEVPTKNAIRDKIETMGGGGISAVVDDTTPQLGGDLDLNTFKVGAATAADLTKLNALTATSTELNYVDGVTSDIQTQFSGKQPLDSDLTTIAGLTATTDSFLQSKASAWASRTVAQVKTDLGLTGTNSGDQTSIVGITGTKAQFDTAVSDGNIVYVGDNATTASALAANGSNCSAGNSPLGVDAAGASESCFDVWSEAENTSAAYLNSAGVTALIDTSAELRAIVADESGTGALIFAGGNIGSATGSITGNAGTATALAANGANCSAGSAPLGVDASGAAETCTDYEEDLVNSAGLAAAILDESGTGVVAFTTSPAFTTPNIGSATGSITGNAGTATALAANGANCSAGQYPLGVDASGAVETCTAAVTTPDNADYLVGTANGSLSAEIVVGTTPGGELGGTWASPTLDDSVSVATWTFTGAPGSTHSNGATSAGSIAFAEDSDNGANTATLIGPASTANVTLTLQATTGTVYSTGGTDVSVADGGTGRSTSTTAYGLIAAGTTATGALQTLAAGATTQILVGGGAAALPVWTTAQGSGAPVRAVSPTLTTPNIGSATGSISGNAGTATALAANPSNCSAGSYPLGIDASGAVESCTVAGGATLGTATTGAGATSYDFTIAAGTKEITFSGSGISSNGTSDVIIQFGDAGGIETTGYAGVYHRSVTTTVTNEAFSSGIIINGDAAGSDTLSGSIVCALVDNTNNIWSCNGGFSRTDATVFGSMNGAKTLSQSLTTLRITTAGGANTIDAGTFNVVTK